MQAGIGCRPSGVKIAGGNAGNIGQIVWGSQILGIKGGEEVKQCDCVAKIEQRAQEKLNITEGGLSNLELLSGRTFSTFSYEETKGKRTKKKELCILHSFCPFCGKSYVKEEAK